MAGDRQKAALLATWPLKGIDSCSVWASLPAAWGWGLPAQQGLSTALLCGHDFSSASFLLPSLSLAARCGGEDPEGSYDFAVSQPGYLLLGKCELNAQGVFWVLTTVRVLDGP